MFTWWGIVVGLGVLALPAVFPRSVPLAWLLWALGLGYGLVFHLWVGRDWSRLVPQRRLSWTGAAYDDIVLPDSDRSYSQHLAGWALVAVVFWLGPFFWTIWNHQGAPPDALYSATLLGGLAFPGSVFASAGYWGWQTYRHKDRRPGQSGERR